MKIQLVSDLHMGKPVDCEILNPEADILVLAGDIVTRPAVASWYINSIQNQTDIPVLYILGNHEFYGNRFPEDIQLYKEELKKLTNCHILEREIYTYQDVNFLGTTLWSDLSDPFAAQTVKHGLNDYTYIRKRSGHIITPADTHKEHIDSLRWLEKELKVHENETNVVITHHAPLWDCRARDFDYQRDSKYMTAGFCSNLETLIRQHKIHTWLYGHVHRNYCNSVGSTKVISNSKGFDFEREMCEYNQDLLIEV